MPSFPHARLVAFLACAWFVASDTTSHAQATTGGPNGSCMAVPVPGDRTVCMVPTAAVLPSPGGFVAVVPYGDAAHLLDLLRTLASGLKAPLTVVSDPRTIPLGAGAVAVVPGSPASDVALLFQLDALTQPARQGPTLLFVQKDGPAFGALVARGASQNNAVAGASGDCFVRCQGVDGTTSGGGDGGGGGGAGPFGDPASVDVHLYGIYASTNPDCSDLQLVESYGVYGGDYNVVGGALTFANAAAGQYPCVALQMSNVLHATAASSFGGCVAGVENTGDIHRDGDDIWLDASGLPVPGHGSEGAPGEDAVAIFLTTSPDAAIARGISASQVLPLGNPLESPGATELAWDMRGSLDGSRGRCSLEHPGVPRFVSGMASGGGSDGQGHGNDEQYLALVAPSIATTDLGIANGASLSATDLAGLADSVATQALTIDDEDDAPLLIGTAGQTSGGFIMKIAVPTDAASVAAVFGPYQGLLVRRDKFLAGTPATDDVPDCGPTDGTQPAAVPLRWNGDFSATVASSCLENPPTEPVPVAIRTPAGEPLLSGTVYPSATGGALLFAIDSASTLAELDGIFGTHGTLLVEEVQRLKGRPAPGPMGAYAFPNWGGGGPPNNTYGPPVCPIWAKSYSPTPGRDADARGVDVTKDKGSVFAGMSNRVPGAAGQNLWVGRLDRQGKPMWSNVFDAGESVYVWGGAPVSQSPFDETYVLADGPEPRTWVLKLDAKGNVLWSRHFGIQGFTTPVPVAIAATADGGAAVLVRFYPSMGRLRATPGILKLRADGTAEWLETLDVADVWADPAAIRQTADGGYIVGSDAAWAYPNHYSAWVIKLAANGAVQWDKRYGDLVAAGVWDVAQTTDQGFIVGANYQPKFQFPWPFPKQWLLRLDKEGNVTNEEALDDKGDVLRLNHLDATSDNGWVVAGDVASKTLDWQGWLSPYFTTDVITHEVDNSWTTWNPYAAKFSAAGAFEWQYKYGGPLRNGSAEVGALESIRECKDCNGVYMAAGRWGTGWAWLAEEAWVYRLGHDGRVGTWFQRATPYAALNFANAVSDTHVVATWQTAAVIDLPIVPTPAPPTVKPHAP